MGIVTDKKMEDKEVGSGTCKEPKRERGCRRGCEGLKAGGFLVWAAALCIVERSSGCGGITNFALSKFHHSENLYRPYFHIPAVLIRKKDVSL